MAMKKELAKFIDHTNVSPNSTEKDIEKLCKEAIKYKFNSVCVPVIWVEKAKRLVKNMAKVIAVVGFPFGFNPTESKVIEAKIAVEKGADEIDMVLNRCWLKSKKYDLVERDIREVVKAAGKKGVKVILETPDLNEEEIKKACLIARKAGAEFIKTCTGLRGGVKLKDLEIIKKTVPGMKIKASGGIRDYRKALKLIKAGASRIGSSSGVKIIKGLKVSKKVKY
ncbi:MAG: deoxyribose-phosphate aldolase [Candidatus Aenigmatarchaeota archaeon]